MRDARKQYIPLESNEPQVIGSITNQLLYELLSEIRELRADFAEYIAVSPVPYLPVELREPEESVETQGS